MFLLTGSASVRFGISVSGNSTGSGKSIGSKSAESPSEVGTVTIIRCIKLAIR